MYQVSGSEDGGILLVGLGCGRLLVGGRIDGKSECESRLQSEESSIGVFTKNGGVKLGWGGMVVLGHRRHVEI